jgi:Zn-dependent peptidase ImmA (M78 family)
MPDVTVTAWALPVGYDGLSRIDAAGHRSILYSDRLDHVAARPVIAHEIAHHLTDLPLARVGERGCAAPGFDDDTVDWIHVPEHEDFCDLLAGELLAPLARLIEDVDDGAELKPPRRGNEAGRIRWINWIHRLASKYNVPEGFIEWRLLCWRAIRADPRFIQFNARAQVLLASTFQLEPVPAPQRRASTAKPRRRRVAR